jgi:peptidoglycan/xylan/chitin deacetylase (PgdA/CDA1 family)
MRPEAGIEGARCVSVCFRFDDPSAISDHRLESQILGIFEEIHIPLTVAAIPFSRTPSGEMTALSSVNAPHLLEAAASPLICMAQHGHSHIHRGRTTAGAHSEFAGLADADQLSLIKEGMEHLSSVFGREIRGFVPPWNTYDHATARAADELGFLFLSAGSEVFQSGGLPVIPRTCTLRNARTAIEQSSHFQALSPVVVVVFHPDDFEEFRDPPLPDEPPPFTNLHELRALLEWLTVEPWVQPASLDRLAQQMRGGSLLWNPSELRVPWRIKAHFPPLLARSSKLKAVPALLAGSFRNWQAAARPSR